MREDTVTHIGDVLASLLMASGPALVLRDTATGAMHPVLPQTAGAADGLLPVFLVAAEAVWREATGHGFGLDVRRDPDSLLGYRIDNVGAVPLSAVLLCMVDAIEQATGPAHLVVNDLATVTQAAWARTDVMANCLSAPDVHPG
jgi:hypothetical protein